MIGNLGTTGSIPARLKLIGLCMALSGILSLAGYTLHFSPFFIIAASAIAVMSGFVVAGIAGQIKWLTSQTANAIGSFIRGSYGARTRPADSNDEFARLQYRINHLFDILDLLLRGGDASVHFDEEAVYIEKLRQSALYLALSEHHAYPYQPAESVLSRRQFSHIAHEADELQLATAHVQLLVRELVDKAERPADANASPWAEDFNETIRQIATQAADASQIVSNAIASAEHSHQSLQQLRTVSDRISEALTHIEQLSAQSNMLALNATIAGARGDGKFTDVASGVRALAEETKTASAAITAHIDEIRSFASEAVRTVYEMVSMLRKVSEVSAGLQWSAERQHAAPSSPPTLPMLLGDAQEALQAAERLRERAVRLNAEVKQLSDAA